MNVEKEQTALFNELGVFFAFSKDQFGARAKKDVEYINMGAGMLCPKQNVERLINDLDAIYKEGAKRDIAENGREGVIRYELNNHEALYTYDIEDTVDVLSIYEISREEIQAVFNKMTKEDEVSV